MYKKDIKSDSVYIHVNKVNCWMSDIKNILWVTRNISVGVKGERKEIFQWNVLLLLLFDSEFISTL